MNYSLTFLGHPYAICAVPYATLEEASAQARLSCRDALETRVYSHRPEDGATGFQGAVGVVVLRLNGYGFEVIANEPLKVK